MTKRSAASQEAGEPIKRSNRPTRTHNGAKMLEVSTWLLSWLDLLGMRIVGSASWASTRKYLDSNQTGPSGLRVSCLGHRDAW